MGRCLVAALGLLACFAEGDQVVVSEIMYHPKGDLPEYVELFNQTATPLDMIQWRASGGVRFRFPDFNSARPQEAFFQPGERIVLTSSESAMAREVYGIPSSVRVFGPWEGRLDDSGDRITIRDKNDIRVTSVRYNDQGDWSPAADGAGHSLVLVDPNRQIDDWRNWTISDQPNGTPGTEPVLEVDQSVADPEVDLSQGLPLIRYDHVWKYDDRGINLGTAWKQSQFNDSTWKSGRGLLGEENSSLPQPGLQTNLNKQNQLTYYFRTEFQYTGETDGATISIDQIIDDGVVYYLNGQEIGRFGMPGGNISFTTTASRTVPNAAEEKQVVSLTNAPLVSGRNVIAAEVHQTNTTSSDIVFGIQLNVSAPTRSGIVINEVLVGGAGGGYVEFYNSGAQSLDLIEHFISDTIDDLGKNRIRQSRVIPARGLASLSLSELGIARQDPLTIFLTAPDGKTLMNGFSASLPADGRSIGRKPSGGSEWFLFAQPTRNLPNSSSAGFIGLIHLNEIHFSEDGTSIDWIEFYNESDAELPLDGTIISALRDFSDATALTGAIPSRGVLVQSVSIPVLSNRFPLYFVDGGGLVLDSRVFRKPRIGKSLKAFPDGSSIWHSSTESSPDSLNEPPNVPQVVINEIMFDPPSDQVDGEYIELFNYGNEVVDLSGWEFNDGVSYEFPDNTLLEPGAYLVVAGNSSWMKSAYGAIPVVGDYSGVLSNQGERIRLVDWSRNLVDEVDYRPGGSWPNLTNGDGSSMELVHPEMDNSRASAWRDSDETNKSQMASFKVPGRYLQLNQRGRTTDYKELHFFLTGDGHAVLSNISLNRPGSSQNLLNNANRLSQNNRSADGWLVQGTHAGSFLSNQGRELHIVADGHGDNRANRIELDALALNRNQDFEFSFSARWVSGTPRLICQTWDHSISGSIRLEIPRNLGSPGKVNSVHQSAPLPQVDDLMHHPAVPRSSETVRVTARVSSVNPLQQVVIVHRADSGNGGGAWSAKPMYDDGKRGGDEIAGDGIYTGQLTEHRTNGRVVQFYVGAVSQDGGISEFPKSGEQRPALYVVDNPEAGGDLRRVRFVVSQLDLDAISDRDNSSTVYGYRYPRLSNHYFNATYIGDEENVVYNCEIRNSGSPWTRGTNLNRGKFKFPKDRLFRGHEKLSYDNDPTSGRMHHNRITRHMLYLLGHEVNENEYIRFAVNSGSFSIKEEVEPLANHLLDRNFKNGSQGELYRIDDEWWFQDNWDRAQRNADWEFKGTYQSGRYHSEWMKRSREVEDDYSSLINLFDVVTKNRYNEEEINLLVDPDRIMIMSAVRGYIDDWDSFSLNRGKNGYLYRRPDDGKFQFFHWDSDLAFRNSQAAFLNGMPGFREWSRKSYNRRLFRYYLTELMNRYTRNSPRMNAWLAAEENSSTLYRIDSGFYQNWFSSRNRPARTEIGGNLNIAFNISTGGGNTITTDSDRLTLEGSAPTDVFDIVVEDHPEASVEWTTDSRFRITGIRLASNGPSPLRILGVNHEGITVRSDTVTVNRTGNASPIASLKAFPPSWRIPFDEILGLDATRSLDPEGDELQYTWSVNPQNNVLLEADLIGDAAASFEFPGLYRFAVEVQDSVGNTGRAIGEAAVYGREGFSPFNDTFLEDFWQVQGTELRDNFSPESWYSLAEKSGRLTLQVLDGKPQSFLGNVNNSYPSVVRDLPEGNRWAFLSEVGLENRRFGEFMSGILIKSREASVDFRYFFGIEDGERLSFKRVTANGGLSFVKSVTQTVDQVSLRVQRNGNDLLFEYQEDDQWQLLHRQPLVADSRTSKAGLFLSTFEPQSIQSSFAYAILVNPEVVSPLKDRLIVSEIHYHPLGEGDLAGGEFEFIELLNVSDKVLDLTGVHFVDGIDYTFGDLQLSPGQRVVVAKNPEAFLFRYSQLTGLLAEGGYGGQLNNNGERITLLDSRDAEIFSFRFNDAGGWPSRADGIGSSLVLSDVDGKAKDADSWIASIEFHGSPGDTGEVSPLPVVINEVLSHTDFPYEDAVELHNRSGESVSIGGWYLSDDLNELTKYRIPDGTVISAGGYHVIYEISFDFTNTGTPFSLDSANGEFVHLTAADSNGSLIQFVDGPFIPASENAISSGRHPKGDGSFVPMANLTMGSHVSPLDPPEAIFEFRKGTGAPNSLPKVGPIVFNRIMYHPIDGGSEFLELVNPTSQAVSLFDPEHPANTWQVSGGISFTFPENITLQSGEAVLLTGLDPTLFRDLESIPDSVRVFGPYTGNLNNAGETIELLKPDTPQGPDTSDPGLVPMLLVETVDYDDNLPWPPEADGSGPALNRINPGRFADDPSNWTTDDIPVDPETDSDSDGMPDSFELAHGFDPQSSVDADLDADGDGLDNLGEFLAGTNPLDSTSGLWISAITVSADQVVLQAFLVAGKIYRIQFADSITNNQWTVMETIESQGESGLFEIVDSNVSGIGIRFYRIVLD